MKISVIIVSYNVKFYIEQAILSVLHSTGGGIETEIFVVDNNSSDNSVGYLKQKFPPEQYPDIRFIANFRNVGFGRANNQAVKQAKGDYILFLNPDTVLSETTLSDCVHFAERHPYLGALGVKMLKTNGEFAFESRRGLPTPWTAFCKMSGLASAFPKSKIFGKYYMRYLDESQAEEIEIVSGAFFLTPKTALDACGSFDEAFFMYGEDIDLSYRLLLSGRKNYYLPTPILHYKGESTHRSSYRYVHVFYEAMLIFFQKHYKHYHFTLSLLIKTAIYVQAFFTLVKKQVTQWKKFFTLGKRTAVEHFLFLGNEKNFSVIRDIAEHWGLDIDCVQADMTSRPEGHLSPDIDARSYRYVIYDRQEYDIRHAFELFQRSSHRHDICIFDPECQNIITGRGVYTHSVC